MYKNVISASKIRSTEVHLREFTPERPFLCSSVGIKPHLKLMKMHFGKRSEAAKHSIEERPDPGTPPADRDRLAAINQQLLSDSRCAQVRPEQAVKLHVRKGEREPRVRSCPVPDRP